MLLPSTHPKQYQDVKANLRWYTTIILAIIGILFYSFVLPDRHQQILNSIFGKVLSSQIVGSGIIMVFFGFIGWLMVFILEIHDKIYDRYFTKWRSNYTLYFILPTLVRPFTNNLDRRFFSVAKKNKYEFMKPFYYFAADYEHEHKIKMNLVVRFYEAVTKYWITQINEIILFTLLLLIFVYYFVYLRLSIALNAIVIMNFIVAILFLTNRWAVRITKEEVWKKTLDEIEDIHRRFLNELEEELKKLHEKFGLNYGEN